MADDKRRNPLPANQDQPPPKGAGSDIIPGQHGKHGGSLESEGEPQDEGREANAPRKADDTASDR